YLSVGMIYLKDNPLLREPLKPDHVKHRLLGHWGASPALSFVWVHLNRLIVRDDLDVLFAAAPGPGPIGSPVRAETPGSIHEGGELGYSLSHAYGMAFDNPDLIVACVVGDG